MTLNVVGVTVVKVKEEVIIVVKGAKEGKAEKVEEVAIDAVSNGATDAQNVEVIDEKTVNV